MSKAPRVTHIDGKARSQSPCQQTVQPPERDTREWRLHIYQNWMRGLPPEQCARPSSYAIDGVPLCPSHAGERALSHLLGERS